MKRRPTDLTEGHVLSFGVDFRWKRAPKHALDIPALWAKGWDGEFHLKPSDVMTREEALQDVAENNRKQLAEAGGEFPAAWWLAFEVGEIEKTSFVLLEHGAAGNFFLDASLTLVKPTAEEIERLGAMPATPKRPRKGGAK